MTKLEQVATVVGAVVAVISIVRAGFAIATFFADLSANIRALTDAVRVLTDRLADHDREVNDLRNRVVHLESWRDAA